MKLYLITYKDSTGFCDFLICESSASTARESMEDITGAVEVISVEAV